MRLNQHFGSDGVTPQCVAFSAGRKPISGGRQQERNTGWGGIFQRCPSGRESPRPVVERLWTDGGPAVWAADRKSAGEAPTPQLAVLFGGQVLAGYLQSLRRPPGAGVGCVSGSLVCGNTDLRLEIWDFRKGNRLGRRKGQLRRGGGHEACGPARVDRVGSAPIWVWTRGCRIACTACRGLSSHMGVDPSPTGLWGLSNKLQLPRRGGPGLTLRPKWHGHSKHDYRVSMGCV